MVKYLKTDFYRIITSWRFYAGIVGTGLLYLLAGYQLGVVPNVYMSYLYNGFLSTAILAYVFCSVPFSGCFIEDREHGYWLPAIQKGSLRDYIYSKVLSCFLSGVLTMVAGTLLFSFLLRLRLPFFQEFEGMDAVRMADRFGFLIREKTILLYFLCSAAVNGMLGGLFSVIAAFLSLYEPYRIFVICAPAVGFYFLENILINHMNLPYWMSIWGIFSPGYSMSGNLSKDLLLAFGITLLILTVVGFGIQRKVGEEVFETQSMGNSGNECKKYLD